jgi:predicted N-acetyltransferase YhbS
MLVFRELHSTEQFGTALPVQDFRYKDYPAIKLARLAVDARLQGQGVGSQLVNLMMGLVSDHIMPYTGCRFLVVDSKATSVGFYERKDFLKVGTVSHTENSQITMMIDLSRNTAIKR